MGIHGTHLGPGVAILLSGHSDEARQVMAPWVEYNDNGRKTVYAAADAKPGGAGLTMREMDCMDCHNRPAHTFDLPDRALDRAMVAGQIAPTLPFAKKTGLVVLKTNYRSREEAATRIPADFGRFYQQSYPAVWSGRQPEITAAAAAVLSIYDSNIFPAMNVTWGKYPLNLGHTDFPGCFRCHDGSHNAKDGTSITQECTACHSMLAMDEKNPKILTDLAPSPPGESRCRKRASVCGAANRGCRRLSGAGRFRRRSRKVPPLERAAAGKDCLPPQPGAILPGHAIIKIY